MTNKNSQKNRGKDPFGESTLNKTQLVTYLLPLIGWIPSLWTLYRRQGSKEQLRVSRFSVTITLVWGISYALLWLGSLQTSEIFTFRLLYVNGLLTSAYILLSLGLIIRVFQGKSLWIPGRGKLTSVRVKELNDDDKV